MNVAAVIVFLSAAAVLFAAWAIPTALAWALGYAVALIERVHDNPDRAHDLTRDWADSAQTVRAARLERKAQ